MPATIQFVDSIAASPTVRLDVNDGVAWFCTDFSAPPPRLRRSESENAMRDGGVVGSSSYGNRTLTLALTLINATTEDAAATEMQKLWRELDRGTNYLRYQREGMTKPVFFRLFRSDASDLEELWTVPIARNITLELLAEPFALGLKETLGPYTVSNDPAAASNPGYVDLPTILGDVPAEFVYWDTASGGSTYQRRYLAAHSRSAVAVTPSAQLETWMLGTDTTNPGGGPDAAMSGTGTNNYVRTSFATSSLLSVTRLSASISQPSGGSYRLIAAVRRTGISSTLKVMAKWGGGTMSNTPATLLSSVSRQLVDLGVVASSAASPVGYSGTAAGSYQSITLHADRAGGTDSLDWDAVFFLPAGGHEDGSTATSMILGPAASLGSSNVVIDGPGGQAFITATALNPTTSGAYNQLPCAVAGGFPLLAPGSASNRLYALSYYANPSAGATWAKTTSTAINIAYWPRYLFVRPVST